MTVEILGVVHERDVIATLLTGWRDEMEKTNSLAWVRARVAGADGSGR